MCLCFAVDRNATEPGRCTCGEGRCVSYSRDMSTSSVYYYCGPCGWVGARCVESNCTHEQAKCSNGYCECVQGGLFYDLSVCYYPSFGKTMIIEMLVSSLIVVAMCGVLAFSYNRLSRSRQRDDGSSTFPWRRGSGSREKNIFNCVTYSYAFLLFVNVTVSIPYGMAGATTIL
nr:uncharacterized protein LOC113819865 [Penaeus vannamei]